MARPPESSSMLEIALAVTTRWRVWGFVTRGPSRMLEVSRAAPARARAAGRGARALPLTYSQTQEQIPGHHLGALSRGSVEHSFDQEGGQAVDAGPRGEGKVFRRLLRAHEPGTLAIHDGGHYHRERVTGDLTKRRKG